MQTVIGPTALATTGSVVLNEGVPYACHTLVVQGTFTGLTVVVEGSADGINYVGLKLTQASTAGTVASDVVSANGIYTVTLPVALQWIRARVTAISTGSALLSLCAA